MPGMIDIVVFVTVEVLRSSYRPVYVPGMIDKVVVVTVEIL